MKIKLERIVLFLLAGILTVVALVYASQVLKPVVLACMLAMLMAPLCSWLDKKGVSRSLSALICVFILLVAILTILSVVTAQFISFSEDWPLMEKRADKILHQLQSYVKNTFSISPHEQLRFLKKQMASAGSSMGAYAGAILGGITSTFGTLVLMLVFTFLLLFNKEKYETFFVRLFKEVESEKVKKELAEIAKVSQSYLTGRAISMSIQAVLFSVGLSIIGIKGAVLLGCIAALLTILPYVGTFTGGMFPILTSIMTEDSLRPTLWVVVLLVVVQVLDNYFIEPNVVGGKVHLNALFTILIILIGGLIWGAVGMILFTPMLGIFKIICDHVESLQPYGYLVGDDESESEQESLSKRIKKTFQFIKK